ARSSSTAAVFLTSDDSASPGLSHPDVGRRQEDLMIEDTLAVPGARLYYERRGSGPVVLLVAAPMGAGAFAPLADLLPEDHTVITTDPRGISRSTVEDPDQDSTPQMRADDIARLLRHVNGGPALLLGSSGGAVSVLALAQAHPELVHTVVAHEPPLIDLLPDR